MNSIPIFDSLTHPMPNGGWLRPEYDGINTVENVLAGMKANNVGWAFAVGMGDSIGGYNEDEYSNYIHINADNLFPVAYLDFSRAAAFRGGVDVYMSKLKSLGYVGVKIHPRFSRVAIDEERVVAAIRSASSAGLLVFLCSYFWGGKDVRRGNGPEALERLLDSVPDVSMILLHGGGVRILEYAEIVRFYPGIVIDMSFTLCKYQGSSIDLDIAYLFRQFDRRISVGSDSPEFSHAQLRERFDYFSKGVEESKVENIGFRNLLKLLEDSNATAKTG